jgi:hypothetical protein
VPSAPITLIPLELTRKTTPSSILTGPSPKQTLSIIARRPATRQLDPTRSYVCNLPTPEPRTQDEATIDSPDGVVKSLAWEPRSGRPTNPARGRPTTPARGRPTTPAGGDPAPRARVTRNARSRGTEAPRPRARHPRCAAWTIPRYSHRSEQRRAATLSAQSSVGPTTKPSRSAPRRRRASTVTRRQPSSEASATYSASYVFAHPSLSAIRHASSARPG